MHLSGNVARQETMRLIRLPREVHNVRAALDQHPRGTGRGARTVRRGRQQVAPAAAIRGGEDSGRTPKRIPVLEQERRFLVSPGGVLARPCALEHQRRNLLLRIGPREKVSQIVRSSRNPIQLSQFPQKTFVRKHRGMARNDPGPERPAQQVPRRPARLEPRSGNGQAVTRSWSFLV